MKTKDLEPGVDYVWDLGEEGLDRSESHKIPIRTLLAILRKIPTEEKS